MQKPSEEAGMKSRGPEELHSRSIKGENTIEVTFGGLGDLRR